MKKKKKRKLGLVIFLLVVVAAIAAAAPFCYKTYVAEKEYKAAVSLVESGEYDAAIPALEALNGYKDADALIENCQTAILDGKYAAAAELVDKGEYDAAIPALEALDGYKDADALIENCRTAILDGKYAAAAELAESGDYDAAIPALEALDGYKDSGELLRQCKTMRDALKVKVGDVITFGHFEQDNNASNGKEPIAWIVLEKEDLRVFVISEYALFAKGYHEKNKGVTWETCSLRAWLNGEFLGEAFSAEEQAQIPTVTVPPAESPKYHTDPGNATEDKLFLISIADLNKYFPTDSDRECKTTPYALANGAQANESNGNCWWWLRSPGIARNCAARVNCYGSLRNSGPPVSSYYSCVRPAMWIDLVP